LYCDEWLVAVAKPAGELVVPGWARGERTTMARVRNELGQWVFPAHRLDRGTSGVVLMARDAETAAALGACFREGRVRKRYLALVRGEPPESGLVEHPLRRGEHGEDRLPAATCFRRLGRSPHARCSLIEAVPLTGRLHQLRRHLRHLSHPIVGDVRYGDGRVNRAFRADWDLRRLALHAAAIALNHPVSGAPLEIAAALPDDLAAPLAALGLSDAS
jgi:tRNA pseudouridine65 synthase